MKYKRMKLFLGSLLVAGLLTLGCEDNNQPILGVDDTDPNPTGGPASSITVLSPTEGFLKDVVVIQGSGFNTTPGYNLVRFGNKVGTVTAATATELTVQTPNLADVTVMVQVAVKGSEVWSNELPFTFKPTLTVVDSSTEWPNGVDVDDDGNVYFGATVGEQIIKVTPDGVRSVFADVPVRGAVRFGPGGYLYVCEKWEGKVVRISPDGATIEDVADVSDPTSLDWDADGNLYIVSGDAGINIMDSGGNLSYVDLDGASVKNCRVFDGYLYISKIWDAQISRFPINGGSLGEEEVYLDTNDDGYSPSSFEFDENGTMYWSHAWDTNLYTLTPDGSTGEVLYEGEMGDPAGSPLRYMTFHNKSIYAVYPGWGEGGIGQVQSAYIGVMQAPNYGRQ